MNFHVLTLFPDMIIQGLSTSIIGRAIQQNKISLEAVDIRQFSADKHRRVDDYTYGGGAGMLMQAQPVYDAWKSVEQSIPSASFRTIYVTPQGTPFTQKMASEFAGYEDLIFLCGHYEGIDERVLEEVVTDYVSIGDYVLTGGELPVMVMIDVISRLIPGVLHNEISAETESFHAGLLEYPQYSRPEIWHGKQVPQVLLSGNNKEIVKWNMEQSVERTKQRRPDLYRKYQILSQIRTELMKQKLLHIDMMESIARGNAELIYQSRDGLEILLQDMKSGIYMYTNLHEYSAEAVPFLEEVPDEILAQIHCIVLHQQEFVSSVQKRLLLDVADICYHCVCTRREKLPVTGLYRPDGQPTKEGLVIRRLDESYLDVIAKHYHEEESNRAYLLGRIAAGELYGAFSVIRHNGQEHLQLLGFAGTHMDGSMGFLTVLPEYRHKKVAMALETYLVNRQLEQGWIPYGQIHTGNQSAQNLQKKIGLYLSKSPIVRMSSYNCNRVGKKKEE